MSLPLFSIIAAAAVLIIVAVVRVMRARAGRDARPDGWRLWASLLAVLIVPPIVLVALAGPPAAKGDNPPMSAVIAYFVALGVLIAGMFVAAMLVRRFAPERHRPILLLALVGRESSPSDVPVDPAMTPEIAASVTAVNTANAAFPRGAAFIAQPTLPGFEASWDALDVATRDLERLIKERVVLGAGVSNTATAAATDARSRLDSLRQAAALGGQAWATA